VRVLPPASNRHEARQGAAACITFAGSNPITSSLPRHPINPTPTPRDAFMAVKQDLLLAFVDCVERNGAKLATPRAVVSRLTGFFVLLRPAVALSQLQLQAGRAHWATDPSNLKNANTDHQPNGPKRNQPPSKTARDGI
jgi:hypothetical protein